MKTTFVIVFVLFAVGLVAGFVVPPESRSEASLAVAAEQPITEPPPNRLVSNRNRGDAVTNSADGASDPAPLLTSTGRGAAVPWADILGVAGLLGGSVVTVLLLQGGRPAGGQRDARSEAPRHQPQPDGFGAPRRSLPSVDVAGQASDGTRTRSSVSSCGRA